MPLDRTPSFYVLSTAAMLAVLTAIAAFVAVSRQHTLERRFEHELQRRSVLIVAALEGVANSTGCARNDLRAIVLDASQNLTFDVTVYDTAGAASTLLYRSQCGGCDPSAPELLAPFGVGDAGVARKTNYAGIAVVAAVAWSPALGVGVVVEEVSPVRVDSVTGVYAALAVSAGLAAYVALWRTGELLRGRIGLGLVYGAQVVPLAFSFVIVLCGGLDRAVVSHGVQSWHLASMQAVLAIESAAARNVGPASSDGVAAAVQATGLWARTADQSLVAAARWAPHVVDVGGGGIAAVARLSAGAVFVYRGDAESEDKTTTAGLGLAAAVVGAMTVAAAAFVPFSSVGLAAQRAKECRPHFVPVSALGPSVVALLVAAASCTASAGIMAATARTATSVIAHRSAVTAAAAALDAEHNGEMYRLRALASVVDGGALPAAAVSAVPAIHEMYSAAHALRVAATEFPDASIVTLRANASALTLHPALSRAVPLVGSAVLARSVVTTFNTAQLTLTSYVWDRRVQRYNERSAAAAAQVAAVLGQLRAGGHTAADGILSAAWAVFQQNAAALVTVTTASAAPAAVGLQANLAGATGAATLAQESRQVLARRGPLQSALSDARRATATLRTVDVERHIVHDFTVAALLAFVVCTGLGAAEVGPLLRRHSLRPAAVLAITIAVGLIAVAAASLEGRRFLDAAEAWAATERTVGPLSGRLALAADRVCAGELAAGIVSGDPALRHAGGVCGAGTESSLVATLSGIASEWPQRGVIDAAAAAAVSDAFDAALSAIEGCGAQWPDGPTLLTSLFLSARRGAPTLDRSITALRRPECGVDPSNATSAVGRFAAVLVGDVGRHTVLAQQVSWKSLAASLRGAIRALDTAQQRLASERIAPLDDPANGARNIVFWSAAVVAWLAVFGAMYLRSHVVRHVLRVSNAAEY